MAATQRFKIWFFSVTSVLRDDKSTGGTRLLKTDQPTTGTFMDLCESVTFKKETGDRSKIYTGSADLGTEQGLVVLATDTQAKANTTQLTDRSIVAQPSQLPTNSTINQTIGDFTGDSPLNITVDGTISTRNNFIVSLKSTFITFLVKYFPSFTSSTNKFMRSNGTNVIFDTIQTTDLPVIPISGGGTGQVTAPLAINALLPSQTGNSGDALITNGTVASWSPINYSTLGTVPINHGGTGQTTANTALNALLPTQTGNSGKFLETDGSNTSWNSIGSIFSGIIDRQRISNVSFNTIVPSGVSGVVFEIARRTTANDGITRNYIVHATVDLNSLTTAPETYLGIYTGSTSIGTASVIHSFHFNPSSVNGASTTVGISVYCISVPPNTNIYLGTYILGSTNQYNMQSYELIIDGTPV